MALEVGKAHPEAERAGLAGAIANALSDALGNDFDAKRAKVGIEAIAKAIVEEIQANAEVEIPNGTAGSDTLTGTVS